MSIKFSKLSKFDSEIPIEKLDKEVVIEVQSHLSRLGYLTEADIDGIMGEKSIKAFVKFKKDHNLSHPSILGETSAKILRTAQPRVLVSAYNFYKIFNNTNKIFAEKFFLPLNSAMSEFHIDKLNRITMFLAQISHETRGLRNIEEIASGTAYENRADLGNTKRGDGIRYKGRGLIQLTGRSNYRNVGQVLNIKLEEFPTLALRPDCASRIACYFWASHGCNQLADKDDFKAITERINGGLNGYDNRLSELQRIKSIFSFKD